MERRRYILILAGVIVFAIVLAIILNRSSPAQRINQGSRSPSPANLRPELPTVDLRKYHTVHTKIENERMALWTQYQRATETVEKERIINQARETFVRSVSEEIFPYWYGTSWDFYGTTETPRRGNIACGYFVSTVLRDLGMKVQRAKLAQQASENIILSLTTNDHTKRFRQVSINSFVEAVKSWGSGLYVVGLDVHVGFILNVAGDVYFIHSSYVDPYCVVKERGVDSQILTASRYRVLGKVSEDDDLILKWLRGDQFPTRVA